MHDQLQSQFRDYELSIFPELPSESKVQFIGLYLRDNDAQLVARLEAWVYWDGVEIDLLWVAKSLRGTGIGAALAQQVETQAKEHGAGVSFWKTYGARRFYESAGYQVFDVLEGRPTSTKLFYMNKTL